MCHMYYVEIYNCIIYYANFQTLIRSTLYKFLNAPNSKSKHKKNMVFTYFSVDQNMQRDTWRLVYYILYTLQAFLILSLNMLIEVTPESRMLEDI